MIFRKFEQTALNVLFRPKGAAYGGAVLNEKSKKLHAEHLIELLTEGYGAPVEFEEWETVVNVNGRNQHRFNYGSWYVERRDFKTEIFLTTDEQMSYIAIRSTGVSIA